MTSVISVNDDPPKGIYRAAKPTDLRGPCPLVNSMANHGYLPRDGRRVYESHLTEAMNVVGLSSVLSTMTRQPPFLERPENVPLQRSYLGAAWYHITNPWSLIAPGFGVRPANQVDKNGRQYLNLDQLALHNRVEHDASMTRRDHALGDNAHLDRELFEDMLASSSDGGKTLSWADLAELRKKRIEASKRDNKEFTYGGTQHELACGEIAMIIKIFGDGEKVRCDYMRAFFGEERLPIKEGWTLRSGWSLGILEMKPAVEKVKALIGLKF